MLFHWFPDWPSPGRSWAQQVYTWSLNESWTYFLFVQVHCGGEDKCLQGNRGSEDRGRHHYQRQWSRAYVNCPKVCYCVIGVVVLLVPMDPSSCQLFHGNSRTPLCVLFIPSCWIQFCLKLTNDHAGLLKRLRAGLLVMIPSWHTGNRKNGVDSFKAHWK